jgi:RNA polymerase sigma-70 factor (ECF subfamily)
MRNKSGGPVDTKRDEDLVAACLGGENDAYAALGKTYARRLYAICLDIVWNSEDAEDLVQETLMKGFTELPSLKDRSRFGPWIAAIASNLSRDLLRKRMSEKGPVAAAADCPGGSPEKLIDLRQALRELPEAHRTPLLLFYFDGHSADSVGAMLGISAGAVHQRLCRARRELRKLLENKEVHNE